MIPVETSYETQLGIMDHWIRELLERGMSVSQAEALSLIPDERRGISMHGLLEILEQGCDPDVAFDIAS